jgi:hypothetical protein
MNAAQCRMARAALQIGIRDIAKMAKVAPGIEGIDAKLVAASLQMPLLKAFRVSMIWAMVRSTRLSESNKSQRAAVWQKGNSQTRSTVLQRKTKSPPLCL